MPLTKKPQYEITLKKSANLKFFKRKVPMASNLTKRQIVLEIYNKRNHKQNVVREIVQDTLDTIQTALANGKNIELRKFGVFEIQVRKARVGRNPNRPETDVEIPRRAVVKFKAGKELKAALKDINLDLLEDA